MLELRQCCRSQRRRRRGCTEAGGGWSLRHRASRYWGHWVTAPHAPRARLLGQLSRLGSKEAGAKLGRAIPERQILVETDDAVGERDRLQLKHRGPIALSHSAGIRAGVGTGALHCQSNFSSPRLVARLDCTNRVFVQIRDNLPIRLAKTLIQVISSLLLLVFRLQHQQFDVREAVHQGLPRLALHRLQCCQWTVLRAPVHIASE